MTFFLAGLSMGTRVHHCQLTPWKNPYEPKPRWAPPQTPSPLLDAHRYHAAAGLHTTPARNWSKCCVRCVSVGGTVHHLQAIQLMENWDSVIWIDGWKLRDSLGGLKARGLEMRWKLEGLPHQLLFFSCCLQFEGADFTWSCITATSPLRPSSL